MGEEQRPEHAESTGKPRVFRQSPLDGIIVLIVLVRYALPFVVAVYFRSLPTWSLVAIGFLLIELSYLSVNGTHYHAHLPFFVSKRLNELFSLLLSAVNVEPHVTYTINHVKFHHRLPVEWSRWGLRKWLSVGDWREVLLYPVQTLADITGARWATGIVMAYRNLKKKELPVPSAKFDRRDIGIDDYFDHMYEHILYHLWKGGPSLLRRGILEAFVGSATVIALAVIDFRAFLVFYVPVRVIVKVLLAVIEYVEHGHVADILDRSRDSASCYGRLFNLIHFNDGLHQEHHFRPRAHWTKLPAVTAELPPAAKRRTVPVCQPIGVFMGPSRATTSTFPPLLSPR